MTLSQAEKEIMQEFSHFEDWVDKYQYIIELGNTLPMIDPQYKTDRYLIDGCQSQVWLHAAWDDGRIIFTADSDAIITKGIVNLLIRVLSNRTPDEIINAKLEYIDAIGLREHLSPTRSNGLLAMIKQMKLYAVVFKTKFGV
jgi:cysteine desulfuration protein SufE